ncbi:hypothetical protein [Mucilaginibacter antarcticus]|uniref:hypothetical protein n=1 Tax=Mucilaginibacter antarcticus TaxID=1855725 RepID=UPI003644C5EF
MIVTLTCSFLVTWIGLPVIYLLLSRHKKKEPNQIQEEEHHVKKQRWVSFLSFVP